MTGLSRKLSLVISTLSASFCYTMAAVILIGSKHWTDIGFSGTIFLIGLLVHIVLYAGLRKGREEKVEG